ncbi:Uncharacterised protein [Mycobacteroides abscessus subsp. abscessus]|nr:Uncharacterised protein [Mycobacteroides abscessus subsp. abscessus]
MGKRWGGVRQRKCQDWIVTQDALSYTKFNYTLADID